MREKKRLTGNALIATDMILCYPETYNIYSLQTGSETRSY